MQLFLSAEDIITISTSNKKKPKMKSITNADMYAKRTKSSIKRNTFLNKSQKPPVWGGYLNSFHLVRLPNSNE